MGFQSFVMLFLCIEMQNQIVNLTIMQMEKSLLLVDTWKSRRRWYDDDLHQTPSGYKFMPWLNRFSLNIGDEFFPLIYIYNLAGLVAFLKYKKYKCLEGPFGVYAVYNMRAFSRGLNSQGNWFIYLLILSDQMKMIVWALTNNEFGWHKLETSNG